MFKPYNLIKYKTYLFGILLSLLLIYCSEKQSSHNITPQKQIVSRKDTKGKTSTKKTPTTVFIDSANFYDGIHQYEKAIHYFKKAGDFYKAQNDWGNYILTLNKLGFVYARVSKMDLAYNSLNQALKLALEKIPEQKDIHAHIYYSFGYYYSNQYSPDKAIESYNKALKLWNNSPVYAYRCYYALGNFYLALKDYKTAEEYYIKALKIQESYSSPKPDSLADCYYNIAIANQQIGDYAKAESYIHQAIGLFSFTKNYYSLEICFSAQGLLQIDMEKYDEAIDNLTRALRLNLENKGDVIMRAYHLLNVAYPYLLKGESLAAVKYYKKAIALLGNNDVTSVLGLTDSYMNLGQAYNNLHNQDSALHYFNRCINVSRIFFGSKHPRLSDAYHFLGKYYDENRQYDSALYYYQSAIIADVPGFDERDITKNPTLNKIGSSSTIYEVLAYKANVLMNKYHQCHSCNEYLFAALYCYGLCDSLMIRHKQLLEYNNSKLKFTALCHKVYEKYLECLYEICSLSKDDKYIANALDIMEKNKATLLQNALEQAEALNEVGIPDSLRKSIEVLNKKIIYLDKSILGRNDKSQSKEIQKQLFDARRSQERLKEYIEKTYPFYFSYKYHSNQTDLAKIRSNLTKNQQLIEYFQGDSSIYALAINKEKNIFFKCVHNQVLDSLISTLRYSISTIPEFNNIEHNYQLFTTSSYALYKLLISPLIDTKYSFYNSEPKQLIIIPEGIFSLIPFETLIDTLPDGKNIDFKELPYLIKSFSISYGYSANLLFNKIFNKKSEAFKVLAFSSSGISGQSHLSVQNHFIALPGSSTELKAIKKNMNGTFYDDKDATEFNFKSQASLYSIIHLALHGSADINNADNCKVFFNSGGSPNEDGILYDYELYALKLNASLAVLTACETGLGKYYKGEGIFSMARGFIYAGCPAVVMSYWKINDQITAQQIGFFYQYLKKGQSISQALRNAKLEYLSLADNITAHPANWASLNAWGKTDIQVRKRGHFVLFFIFGSSFIFVLFIFIFKNRLDVKKSK